MSDALAFLSTGEAPALSPLASGTAAAGATYETRDGWEVPIRYADAGVELLACRQAVGWADVSHLPKWELQGPAEALDALPAMPRLADGLAARDGDGAWWCRATPARALVLGGGATPPAAPAGVHVLDVSVGFGALRIVGPLARELFARFCALDLRPQVTSPQAFCPGSVARTPGYVVCEAPDRFLMLFGAAYGAYVWEVVHDAGTHLGGRPVGVDALDQLAGATQEGEPTHA